jgi:hypothetical protein
MKCCQRAELLQRRETSISALCSVAQPAVSFALHVSARHAAMLLSVCFCALAEQVTEGSTQRATRLSDHSPFDKGQLD